MSFRLPLRRALDLALFPLAASALAAQDMATVTGVVRSQRGAPLVEATVRIEPDGAAMRTDAQGRFTFTVPAGRPSTLVITSIGYRFTRTAVPALRGGVVRELAVVLGAPTTLETRTIVAAADRPLLNTESAATGGSIEAQEIAALPTDARDPIALLYNVPGVAQATGFFGDAPRLSLSGGNSLYSQYLLDGLDNNEGFLGGPRVEVPLGAIARMDALVNTYTTQFGRSPDGVVNVTSLAGRDRLAGDLFVYDRPGRPFDASTPVTFGTAPEAVRRRQEGFRRTQVGGALRGALRPGQTHFATALEYTRENEDRIGSTALAQFLGTETRQTIKAFGRLDQRWSSTQGTTLRVAGSDVDRAGNGSGVVTPEADITTRRVGTLAGLTHHSAGRSQRAINTASVQFGTFHWYFPPTESDFSRPQVTVISPSVEIQAVVGSSNFVFDETERQWQLRRDDARAGNDLAFSVRF